MSHKIWTKKNLPALRKIIAEFITSETPTIAGLIRKCKLHDYNQFHFYMKEKGEIGELFSDAYMYMVQTHEERLFNKGAAVNSIFTLKCLRKLGVSYREMSPEETDDKGKDGTKLTIEVVSKSPKKAGE